MPTLLDLLEEHQNNRQKGKRDRRKFGLVLQGGGMRAVYSGGAVATLLSYGVTDAFDHVIGSSAGALHGAYYLAHDQETLRRTYTEDLTNKNFVNLLRRDKKVDIDYLIDMVLKHKRPIDIPRLLRSNSKLHILLTDAYTGRKKVLSDHHKFLQIYEELRATAALPLLYDKRILVSGRYYIDGGVADNLPVDIAVKLKCTDIVLVMTQQIKNYDFSKRHNRLVNHLVKKFAKNQTAGVRKILPSNERLTQMNLRLLTHPTKKFRFYVLEPSNEEFLISLASTDKNKVETLAKLGVTDMDVFLNKEILTKGR